MKALLLVLFTVSQVFAQGPETPSAPPGATQKSLQEIWDALAVQRSTINTNQANLRTASELHVGISESLGALVSSGASDDTENFDFFTIGQGSGYGRECVLMALSSGELVAAFLDEAQNDLKFVRNGSGSWAIETIDFNARGPLAVSENSNGHPSVLFSNPDSPELYITTFNGTTWHQSQIATSNAPDAKVADAPDGSRYAAYIDSLSGDLVFGEQITALQWDETVIMDINPTAGNYLAGLSLNTLSNSQPIVAVCKQEVSPSENITSEKVFILRRTPSGTWGTTQIAVTSSSMDNGISERDIIRPFTALNKHLLGGQMRLHYKFDSSQLKIYEPSSPFSGPSLGFERSVYFYTWDVESLPYTEVSISRIGSPSDYPASDYSPPEYGKFDGVGFIDRSTSTSSFSYDYPYILYRNKPLIIASSWNGYPVEICGFTRPDGRVAAAIRRPFSNDFIIAVEKP